MASQMSRIIPLLVITLCCVGAVELGYSILEYLLLRQPVEETVEPGTPAAKEGPVPAGTKRDYSIILTRNLFGQQFKTEDTPAAPAVDVAANLDRSGLEIVLVGTIGGSEGTHRAIILDKKSRKQDLYKEGDEVKGANIKEILRGKVILDVQGKEELLDMAEAATVRPAVKAPQGPSSRQIPQAGAPPGPVAQPEAGMGPPVSMPAPAAETAPLAEDAPGAVEEAAEPQVESAPEAAAPEDVVPEVAPEAAPEPIPEAAPPAEEPQAPERKIVRPRVVRPYRQ